MNDYDRITKVIEYLDTHHAAQPSLRELAEVAELSESHFHHLFQRWAGVTPKDFLQCLTAQYARERLTASQSVLDTALEAGLSGPGRLHDLLVSLEAASPGELKRRGAGLRIFWGLAETPFGICSIGWNERGICHLIFIDEEPDTEPPQLREYWGAAERVRDDHNARRWCDSIFEPQPGAQHQLRAFVRGTQFQVKVWRALLQVPPGYLTSYGRIARCIGEPRAARAVGGACGDNPIAFLIPCHRVIRETGIVQGYRWGTSRKRAMLAWEGVPGSQAFAPTAAATNCALGEPVPGRFPAGNLPSECPIRFRPK